MNDTQRKQNTENMRRYRASHSRIDYYPSPEARQIIEAERDDDGESCYSYSSTLDHIILQWTRLTK